MPSIGKATPRAAGPRAVRRMLIYWLIPSRAVDPRQSGPWPWAPAARTRRTTSSSSVHGTGRAAGATPIFWAGWSGDGWCGGMAGGTWARSELGRGPWAWLPLLEGWRRSAQCWRQCCCRWFSFTLRRRMRRLVWIIPTRARSSYSYRWRWRATMCPHSQRPVCRAAAVAALT